MTSVFFYVIILLTLRPDERGVTYTMFIDEIPANSTITIDFNYVTKATKLEHTVKRVGNTGKASKCIIADVARVDNKIVNINNFRGKVAVRFLKP